MCTEAGTDECDPDAKTEGVGFGPSLHGLFQAMCNDHRRHQAKWGGISTDRFDEFTQWALEPPLHQWAVQSGQKKEKGQKNRPCTLSPGKDSGSQKQEPDDRVRR